MKLLKPFQIIPQIWALFGIYVGIGIIVGQFGILFSICFCAKHQDVTFVEVLNSNLSAGNFYTFSISLIAAALVPFLIEYLVKKGDIKFKHYKILTSLLVVIIMILMICFYTIIVSDSAISQKPPKPQPIDWTQIWFYVFTMVGCVYAFCLSNLDLDYESYADIDNEDVIRLKKSIPRNGGEDSRQNHL